ncbi:hypothetical protein A5746_19445 [Mycolicibacterium conceptionense]|uniref:alpha/beta hydrolase family protein n=1 Tax=Mycolicibacterium conceptionense TaxID=451644 RepID=UPI0007EC9D5C|nr:alpha/beta fold hydrolase [Mycolicibacterium conceptionense]OBK04245.1 hypothetical protein A5639_21180 [Mycolicibacterium conceptionense]OMB71205.1 hypothetical protein A5741_07405 [Mycolicibacterium conceptionense]OMB92468.1 hypothetical protein A5746_19445 [Mycolicibacterium conceptionense]
MRHTCGSHPEQYVDRWAPGSAPIGLAVLIHGGYWRGSFGADLMEPLAADLTARGWNVANIEYRRVGRAGGYPTTLQDATAAVTFAIGAAPSEHRIVLIGHSVGGELALLNARLAHLVLALAPVTDVRRTFDEDLGEQAAIEFIGATPEQNPDAYATASPRYQLPVGRPVLITHGLDDARVPVAHSRDYRDAAIRHGDNIELREYARLPHGEQINPTSEHWAHAAEWLAEQPI